MCLLFLSWQWGFSYDVDRLEIVRRALARVESEGRGAEVKSGYCAVQRENARLMKGVYRLGKASM